MFATYGTSVLCFLDTKVFSGYLEDDDWLIAAFYHNEFPPYYGVATPSDYFDLQLVVNDEVVASVGILLWGRMPGSIYLSKELADTLEWGSTYTVRMRGSFEPYPTASWVLTPPDWRGEDLIRLDNWVFETADAMSAYYEVSLTTYSNNKKVLNDAGSALFATGIPMLAAIRPHLFLYPEMYIPYTEEDWERTYEESLRWQELLGSKIASDATTVGVMFGLTGQQIAQGALFGTWFVSSIGVAAIAGASALVVTIPLLLLAVLWGVIPVTVIAILGAIFVFLFVWYFWLRGVS